jgi:hypothetical protein
MDNTFELPKASSSSSSHQHSNLNHLLTAEMIDQMVKELIEYKDARTDHELPEFLLFFYSMLDQNLLGLEIPSKLTSQNRRHQDLGRIFEIDKLLPKFQPKLKQITHQVAQRFTQNIKDISLDPLYFEENIIKKMISKLSEDEVFQQLDTQFKKLFIWCEARHHTIFTVELQGIILSHVKAGFMFNIGSVFATYPDTMSFGVFLKRIGREASSNQHMVSSKIYQQVLSLDKLPLNNNDFIDKKYTKSRQLEFIVKVREALHQLITHKDFLLLSTKDKMSLLNDPNITLNKGIKKIHTRTSEESKKTSLAVDSIMEDFKRRVLQNEFTLSIKHEDLNSACESYNTQVKKIDSSYPEGLNKYLSFVRKDILQQLQELELLEEDNENLTGLKTSSKSSTVRRTVEGSVYRVSEKLFEEIFKQINTKNNCAWPIEFVSLTDVRFRDTPLAQVYYHKDTSSALKQKIDALSVQTKKILQLRYNIKETDWDNQLSEWQCCYLINPPYYLSGALTPREVSKSLLTSVIHYIQSNDFRLEIAESAAYKALKSMITNSFMDTLTSISFEETLSSELQMAKLQTIQNVRKFSDLSQLNNVQIFQIIYSWQNFLALLEKKNQFVADKFRQLSVTLQKTCQDIISKHFMRKNSQSVTEEIKHLTKHPELFKQNLESSTRVESNLFEWKPSIKHNTDRPKRSPPTSQDNPRSRRFASIFVNPLTTETTASSTTTFLSVSPTSKISSSAKDSSQKSSGSTSSSSSSSSTPVSNHHKVSSGTHRQEQQIMEKNHEIITFIDEIQRHQGFQSKVKTLLSSENYQKLQQILKSKFMDIKENSESDSSQFAEILKKVQMVISMSASLKDFIIIFSDKNFFENIKKMMNMNGDIFSEENYNEVSLRWENISKEVGSIIKLFYKEKHGKLLTDLELELAIASYKKEKMDEIKSTPNSSPRNNASSSSSSSSSSPETSPGKLVSPRTAADMWSSSLRKQETIEYGEHLQNLVSSEDFNDKMVCLDEHLKLRNFIRDHIFPEIKQSSLTSSELKLFKEMNEKISLFMSVTADELLFSNDLRENFLNVIGVIYKNEAKEYISQFEQFYDSLNAGIKKLLVKNISENKSVHKIEHLEKAVEEACHHIKLEKLQVKCLQPQAESYSNMASPGMNVNH